MRGLFFTFEGVDGAGKSTQVDLLTHWFQDLDLPVLQTKEPGGTPLGDDLREILFMYHDLAPLAELFLFQADRAQHFAQVILPALEQGTCVLSDRCFDSTIAYQGAALEIPFLDLLSQRAMVGVTPTKTFLLDLNPEERYTVIGNRFDLAQQQEVRERFLARAMADPQRFVKIDAKQSEQDIHTCIVEHVKKELKRI